LNTKFFFKMSSRDSLGENGSKRGRTENWPVLRPITPGGAKLGDCMQEIQAKIYRLKELSDSQDNCIKAFIANYELKFSMLETKVNQLLGRLDKIQDNTKEAEDLRSRRYEKQKQNWSKWRRPTRKL